MIGLYKIKKRVSSVNYELELLKGSRIHPIFHVLLLKEAAGAAETSNKEIQLEHELDVYNVERVLDSKVSDKG
jgi:hypothetical protein